MWAAVIKLGLPISLALHGSVLFGFAWFGPAARPLAEAKVIPVEILTIDDVTNVSAAIRAPEPQPKVEEPEVMTTPTPMENAEEEAEVVKTVPKEAPVEKVAEALPKPEISDEPIPTPEPEEKEPEPEEPSFDLDAIAGMIDRSRETAPEKNQQIALESENTNIRYEDSARQAVGEGTGLTATELDMLVAAMEKCWRMPAAATDAENLRVRLKVNFILGGHVENIQLIDKAASRRLSPGNPFWEQAEREAIAAVHKCAPYDFLPDAQFGTWRELVLNLRPQL